MWDIKANLEKLENITLANFHLNHVGYKGSSEKAKQAMSWLSSEPCGI